MVSSKNFTRSFTSRTGIPSNSTKIWPFRLMRMVNSCFAMMSLPCRCFTPANENLTEESNRIHGPPKDDSMAYPYLSCVGTERTDPMHYTIMSDLHLGAGDLLEDFLKWGAEE